MIMGVSRVAPRGAVSGTNRCSLETEGIGTRPIASINLPCGPLRWPERSGAVGGVSPAGREQRKQVGVALAGAQEAHRDLLAHPVLGLQRNQADLGGKDGPHAAGEQGASDAA